MRPLQDKTGILALYLESKWLDNVFTILCGSQGLLIAVANVTTKRLSTHIGNANTSNDLPRY